MDETKNSILIVDDEPANILALTHILKSEYTIYATKSGLDATDKAAELMPDVILLDILMPQMDGYEVLGALKHDSRTADIPVIFITGLDDDASERKGFSMGAADYITKPFNSEIVKLRVANQIKLINQMHLILEKELAEKSNRAKVEFLMNMSHEMLTPMNAIMGMTEIAKRSKNMADISDCLSEIDTASRHLLELINNLLNVPHDKLDHF